MKRLVFLLSSAKWLAISLCHGSLENQFHWALDVSFNENPSLARTGHAPENQSTLRCLALNLLKQNKTQKSSHMKICVY
jgi:predicted transposase YbfD/YdcC